MILLLSCQVSCCHVNSLSATESLSVALSPIMQHELPLVKTLCLLMSGAAEGAVASPNIFNTWTNDHYVSLTRIINGFYQAIKCTYLSKL